MSQTLNQVTLIARVGKDPEIRKTQGGAPIANLSLATSEQWRDKNSGEKKERTEWHRVVVFNEKLAEIVEKYVGKGDLVMVQGQLATRKWTDQSGADRYTTEVVLPRFGGVVKMLSSKNGQQGESRSTGGSTPAERRQQQQMDDDIPF